MKIREIFSKFGAKNDEIAQKFAKFAEFAGKIAKILTNFLLNFRDWSGAKECKSCRSRKMLQNASFLAIVAVHIAEDEPPKVCQKLEQKLGKT